ncbi:tetraacyldisaccharide 4'-kinase [Mesonia sp. K7]|uniref:tetraacyldisaccharide 4'-kinase n=1 Tax=Mesonia sp. K7 TaxID=2218606 RepID=UPI000DA83256|nr:tetraacyldisaccharide 4'-kinase [Mesonia sp. K7]PZD76778.1 tetraacyldisaccharide 4'-kinase [Mesonia sp. K7]
MQILRKLLFPLSLIYGIVTAIRNFLYDQNILKSYSYDLPVITIGNLSTGGTGKSPIVEFLVDFLKKGRQIATLSRGYGRKTKGYRIVNPNDLAKNVGDEPLQFKTKFPEITVAVCEKRKIGIENLQKEFPNLELIILDDAFQHRQVTAGFQILLTAYDSLYCDDFLLPTGNLREPKSGAKRADVIVVTKVPDALNEGEKNNIKNKLKLEANQELFFSQIAYADFFKNTTQQLDFASLHKFTLVTGIANPKPLVKFLEQQNFTFEHMAFSDHHHFSEKEIQGLKKHNKIVTTEKDFMRLQNHFSEDQLYYLPITTKINREEDFQQIILDYLN